MNTEKIFLKQWLHFKRYKSPSDSHLLFSYNPTNAFQLSLWCEVALFLKLEQRDIPNQAIFYFYDHSHKEILNSVCENMRSALKYKIQLVQYFLQLAANQTYNVVRKLQQYLMIADSARKLSNQFSYHKISEKQRYQQIRIKILCEQLQKNTIFTFPQIAKILASYISKHIKFQYNEVKSRILHDLDDISLINVVINNLCDDLHLNIDNNNQIKNKRYKEIKDQTHALIKKFLIQKKKTSVCISMKQHILKCNKSQLIQILFQLLYKLGIQQQAFKYKNMISRNLSLTSKYSEDQLLYSIFVKQLDNGTIKQMMYFQKFMLNYLSGRTIALYKILNVNLPFQQNDGISIYARLQYKNANIFSLIYQSPRKIVSQCIDYYLKQSNFNNPYRLNNNNNRINHQKATNISNQITDPFLFLPIYQKFWNDEFHGQVLAICLWFTLDHWFLYIDSMKNTALDGRSQKTTINQFEQYRKYLNLTFFQIIIGYKINIFINYYPLEKRFLEDIISLPSFCELVLSNQNFIQISWFNFVIGAELKNIIGKQQRSYELLFEVISKKNNFQIIYGNFPLNIIENQLRNIRSSRNLQYIIKVVDYYSEKTNYKEQVTHIEKILANLE